MKRMLLTLVIGAASWCGVSEEANAGDWQIGVRSSSGISISYRSSSRHRHSYRRTVRKIWVNPVYDTIIAGYDRCGNPIYQRVLVRAGYYRYATYGVCGCGSCIPY